jgi:hypothetical protein
MAFLSINGVRIPLELGSARRTNNRDKTERALSGAPLTSRFSTRESFQAKTVPLSLAEAEMVNTFFLGRGEGASYARDLFTEKGRKATSDSATYAQAFGQLTGASGYYAYFLAAGKHPYYANLDDVDARRAGTFMMMFFNDTTKGRGAPNGTLMMASRGSTTSGGVTTYEALTEISIDQDFINFHHRTDSPDVTVQLGLVTITPGLNRLAATWREGGTMELCVNGELAFGKSVGDSAPQFTRLGYGERYPRVSATDSWGVEGSKPFNHELGPWTVLPFTLSTDDLKAVTSPTDPQVYFAPPPYLYASGPLIGVKDMLCEGRVVDTTYLYADQVQLTLELDQV